VVWECGTNAAELRLKNARVRVLKVCAWGGYRIPAIPTMRGAAMASAAPPTAARSPSPALCVLRERESVCVCVQGVARDFQTVFFSVCWCVERGSDSSRAVSWDAHSMQGTVAHNMRSRTHVSAAAQGRIRHTFGLWAVSHGRDLRNSE
jgi:hypothetical protein